MSDVHEAQSNQEAETVDPPLRVGELAAFLQRLAVVEKDPVTGNHKVADGLRTLVETLKQYADLGIDEFHVALRGRKTKVDHLRAQKKSKAQLPGELESLPLAQLDHIIGDSAFTKAQLAEVAMSRFGIPKARLTRLSRDRVVKTIRAAVDHERSLGVISESARRGGEKRSS